MLLDVPTYGWTIILLLDSRQIFNMTENEKQAC